MPRGPTETSRRTVRRAVLLFCLAGGCTGVVTNSTDQEASVSTDDGTSLPDGLSQAKLVWKSSQTHLGAIHGLTAQGTTLYVSADTGLYLFILASTLQPRCSSPSGGTSTPISAPATLDSAGNAYFTRTSQQCLSSIDSGCNPRWNLAGLNYFDCSAASDTQPVLVSGGSQVVIATAMDTSKVAHIFGVNAANGTLAWHETLTNQSVARSLTASASDQIYVGTTSGGVGVLYTLTPSSTTPVQLLTASEFHAPGLVLSNGNLVIGDWNKNLHAVNGSGGTVWKATTGGRVISAPVEANGTVVVATIIFGINALSLTGSPVWNFQNSMVHYAGVAVDSAGVVYLGSAGDCAGGGTGGCVFAIQQGKPVWSYQTERAVEATPLIHSGMVIVGDEGGTIYALSTAD